MSMSFHPRSAIHILLVAMCCVCTFLLPRTTHACELGYYASVHFNSGQPDFGAPPRSFSISSWEEPAVRPIGCTFATNPESDESYHRQARWQAIGIEALQHARRLESAGQFAAAMPHYRNALKHGAGTAAAIMDRQELCEELTPATPRDLLNEYLSARRDYEFSRPGRGEAQMKELAANPHAGILRPHALYVLGAIQYDEQHPEQAADIFASLVKRYPQSRRREAALIMIPRSLLQIPDADARFTQWVGRSIPGGNAMLRSRLALQMLLHEYPQTRFRQSALAWLARSDFLLGHRVAALESYLQQYVTFTGESDRVSAAASIRFVSEELTPPEAKRLGGDLRRNADILGAYLEYRLDHGSDSAREQSRLVDLAAEVAGNHRLHLRAQSAARLAEAEYLRGRYRDAIAWSNRSLFSLPGPGRDLAFYVRGAAYRKSGQGAAAEADFHRLLNQYPTSYLCGAAHENLALLYERSRRPGLALDQYYRLGYQADIAYLLDARMTTRQVTSYLKSHPHHPQHNLLIYTLGIRQLRDNQLTLALATLSRLPEQTIHTLMGPKTAKVLWNDQTNQIRDPRRTARDLAQLERAIHQAHAPNAKAAALYRKASYLYNNRGLLFYNYALWKGDRSTDFSLLWNARAATTGDRTAAREHHYDHECLFRARMLCLKIARQFAQSPVAPQALYRAACASHKLTTFDGWWRKEAVRLRLAEDAIRLMKRVYQQYPHDPLAGSARKFAKVFAEEHTEAVRNTLFEIARK